MTVSENLRVLFGREVFIFYFCNKDVLIEYHLGRYNVNDSRLDRNQKICIVLHSDDPKGMEMLFDAYYSSLVVWADTFLHDMDSAEDVVQELFIDIWKGKIYRNLKPESLTSFLYVSVRNRCLKKIEKLDVFRHVMSLDQVELVFEEYNERHDIIVSKVLEEIDQLPERSREIMKCVFVEGMKYREVAERYGISISTVKTLLGNSVKRLRKRLNKEMVFQLFIFLSAKIKLRKL